MTVFFVIPAGMPADDASFFHEPVGSGPFMVDSFTAGRDVVLVPNPTTGAARRADRLTFRASRRSRPG